MDSQALRQMSIDNAKAALMQSWNNALNKDTKMLTIKNREKIIGQMFTDNEGQTWIIEKMIESQSAYVMHVKSHNNKDYYFKMTRSVDRSTYSHYLLETLQPSAFNHRLMAIEAVKDMNRLIQSMLDMINENYGK